MPIESLFPNDFEHQMRALLGSDAQAFFESLTLPSPTSIRLNPGKKNDANPGKPVPWSQWGYYLDSRPIFTLDPAFHSGSYYVQEPSSMFLEQAVLNSINTSQPIVALDLCAAPGGKSTHLASLLSPESLLVSNEVIRSRVPILEENLQKWGHPNVVITTNDPQDFSVLTSVFDLVVVDAPCSGEGLFRKDPESMKHWSSNNVQLCATRQRRILKDIWPTLKEGGVLIYSTCTFNQQEDEENIKWLANEVDPEFITLPSGSNWGVTEVSIGRAVGYKFFPHKVLGEGFFIAVLGKKSNGPAFSHKTKTKTKLESPSKSEKDELERWVSGRDIEFFKNGDTISFFPSELSALKETLLNHLRVVSFGTKLAASKREKLIPEHEAALSLLLNHDHFTTIDLNQQAALQYLRKDVTSFDTDKKGFALVRYKGNGLGWVNLLGHRVNNLYPANWRIRMKLPE